MNYILLLGQVVLGGYFVLQGINHFRHTAMLAGYAGSKGIPSPRAGVLVSGTMLVLGGLGIVFGQFIGISIILLIVFLLAASFTIHAFWNVTDPQARMSDYINFTKNLGLVGALLMLFALLSSWNF